MAHYTKKANTGKGAAYQNGRQAIVFIARKLNDTKDFYKKRMERLTVVAPMPENFTFGVANEINQPFDFLKVKTDVIQIVSGGVLKQNYDRGISERQFWRAVENKDINVELNFAAYHDAYTDVVKPVQDLLLMGSPVERSLLFGGPQSTWVDGYWNAPPEVQVRFGDLLEFNNCLIKDVTVAFSNKLDANFNPMFADVSVTFITKDPIAFTGIMGYGGDYSGFTPEKG